MNLAWVLLVVLIVALIAGGPYTGWHSWGWGPSGAIGIIVVVVLLLLLTGHL